MNLPLIPPANLKGINVFNPNGRFFLMIANPGFLLVASADNSKIVSNDLSKTNSEEFGGLIAESIAYYGTYTVNETEKVVILHLDASTFPNQVGNDQERSITALTADELIMKYSNSTAISGVQANTPAPVAPGPSRGRGRYPRIHSHSSANWHG